MNDSLEGGYHSQAVTFCKLEPSTAHLSIMLLLVDRQGWFIFLRNDYEHRVFIEGV